MIELLSPNSLASKAFPSSIFFMVSEPGFAPTYLQRSPLPRQPTGVSPFANQPASSTLLPATGLLSFANQSASPTSTYGGVLPSLSLVH